MSTSVRVVVLATFLASALACAGSPTPHDQDVVDVTLPAPADLVKHAVIQVLTDGGYDVDRENDQTLTTGFREETPGPWNWLLNWRFSTGRSRVEADVIPATEQTTKLRLLVHYEGKDGLFTGWTNSPTALPQSATNQLRLIKNALQIL